MINVNWLMRIAVVVLACVSVQAAAQTPPTITSGSSTTFTVGDSGRFTITATGSPTISFSESGALPVGVTLSNAGVLAGAPAVATDRVYPIIITATNGSGSTTQNFTLTVTPALDDDGFVSTVVAFCALDQAPIPTITSPSNGAVVAPNVPINIAATTGNSTNVRQVEFYAATTLVCTVPFSSNGQYNCSWTPTVTSGTVLLTATVVDLCGKRATGSTSVTIDTPPVLTLNSPTNNQSFTTPTPITLDASATSNTSAISSVEFLRNGSQLGQGTTTCCNDYKYIWTNPPTGSHQLSVKATDTFGLYTVTAPITVVVANPPTVALTSPTNNQIAGPNTAVSVVANPTADTANGRSVTTVTVQAKNSSNVVVWQPVNVFFPGYSTTWTTPATAGVYSLTATVTDSRGAVATSAPVSLIVDVPPTVTVLSDNTLLRAPATFHLSANAIPNVGSIQSVTFFYNGTNQLGTGTAGAANTYNYTWSNVGVGTYTVTARATDSYGGTTTSAPITLTVDSGGSITVYYHSDFAGSPLAATDQSGTVLWSEAYAPYGERYLNQNTTTSNGVWFAGKPTEDSSGLSYFGGRWYNPMVGRFYSTDPQRFREDIPLSFNRYAYGNNNPYRFADPNGHTPIDLGFLFWDLGKLGVALYNGSGGGEAAINVGISALAVVIPIPGSGTAIKAARVARAVEETAKLTKAEVLSANAQAGAAFERQVMGQLEATQTGIVQQVTVRTQSGVRTRLDLLGRDASGTIRCTECKSSLQAPLTPNQRAAFPEIEATGATVLGRGKPGFPGGTQIPPTVVDVIRP